MKCWGTRRPTIISLLHFIGSVFVLSLFLCLFLFCILTKLHPSSRSTVAQQFCLVTFYRVLLFLSFVNVDFGVNSNCQNWEHRNAFKQMPACYIFTVQNFYL